MGGSTSKNTTDVLTEIATEITQQSTASCVTSATQAQKMKFKTIYGNIKITNSSIRQTSRIDMQCFLSSAKQANLQDKIAQSFTQYAEAKGTGVLSALGGSKAQVEANIKNMFSTRVTSSSINNAISTSNMLQQNEFTSIYGDIIMDGTDVSQGSELVAKITITDSAYADVIRDISTIIDQTAIAETTNPISEIVGSITSALMTPLLYIIVGFILFIILVITSIMIYKYSTSHSEVYVEPMT